MSQFTRDTLRSVVTQIRKEPTAPLAWQEFEVAHPHSTVKIQWGRGSKEHFRDANHFWLVFLDTQFRHTIPIDGRTSTPLDADTFVHRYLRDPYTQCQEIPTEEFARRVQWYSFIEDGDPFVLQGVVQQAWCVYDENTELALLAETETEFAAFYWGLND